MSLSSDSKNKIKLIKKQTNKNCSKCLCSLLQMFVGLLFWFQFYCGFSASAMIDQWYLIFFNLLFSSLPQLGTGVLDKDVPADMLLREPQLYKSGQNMEVSSLCLPALHSPLNLPESKIPPNLY